MNLALFGDDEVPRPPKTINLALRDDLLIDALRGTKTQTRRTGKKFGGASVRPGDILQFSRTTVLFEVVAVRSEMLQWISEDDALAEGVVTDGLGFWSSRSAHAIGAPDFPTASLAFADLWDSLPIHIHQGGRMWIDNPEVTVIKFRRIREE